MKTGNIARALTGAVFLAMGLILQADAKGILESAGISASGTLDYCSKYMWRGFTVDQDPVVQPGFCIAGYGISFSYWGSMCLTNSRDQGNSDETDISISYTRELGPVSVTAGHINYQFPTLFGRSDELYLTVGTSMFPVDLSVSYNNDYDDGDGTDGQYFSIDAAKSLELEKYFGIGGTVSVHYGFFKDYTTGPITLATAGDCSVTCKLFFPLTDKLSVLPSISYVAPLGDLADDAIGTQEAAVFGGVSLGFEF